VNKVTVCPYCEEETLMDHDTWEDVYRCTKCNYFFEPIELNIKPEHGLEYLKGLIQT
jgi:ribosomal protein L37AE/L43A